MSPLQSPGQRIGERYLAAHFSFNANREAAAFFASKGKLAHAGACALGAMVNGVRLVGLFPQVVREYNADKPVPLTANRVYNEAAGGRVAGLAYTLIGELPEGFNAGAATLAEQQDEASLKPQPGAK